MLNLDQKGFFLSRIGIQNWFFVQKGFFFLRQKWTFPSFPMYFCKFYSQVEREKTTFERSPLFIGILKVEVIEGERERLYGPHTRRTWTLRHCQRVYNTKRRRSKWYPSNFTTVSPVMVPPPKKKFQVLLTKLYAPLHCAHLLLLFLFCEKGRYVIFVNFPFFPSLCFSFLSFLNYYVRWQMVESRRCVTFFFTSFIIFPSRIILGLCSDRICQCAIYIGTYITCHMV